MSSVLVILNEHFALRLGDNGQQQTQNTPKRDLQHVFLMYDLRPVPLGVVLPKTNGGLSDTPLPCGRQGVFRVLKPALPAIRIPCLAHIQLLG